MTTVYPAKPHTSKHLAFDRIWIDEIPNDDRDIMHLFALLSEDSIGVHQYASQFVNGVEILFHDGDGVGSTIGVDYPQTDEGAELVLEIVESDRKDMDYALVVHGGIRQVPTKYYSRKGFEIDSIDVIDLQALRGDLLGR